MIKSKKGIFYLLMFAVLNGLVGVTVRLMSGLDPQSMVMLRAIIATVFVAITLVVLKRTKELRLKRPLLTLFVGVSQGASIWLYFTAVLKTTIANAALLTYTAPIFSVIFAWLLLKEKIEKSTILGVLLAMGGIVFVVNPTNLSFSSNLLIGNMYALASGALYAAMGVLSKPLTKSASGYYIVFWQYLVIALIFTLVTRGVSINLVINNWWQLLFLGVLSTGLAFVLFMKGVKLVKAQKVFVITSLEPIVSILAALVVLGESPAVNTILGAILVFVGVWVVSRGSVAVEK